MSGAVNSPGKRAAEEGGGTPYYVDGLGGLSYRASKRRVSVRYANGEVRTRRQALFVSSDPNSGPGLEVFVPVRDTTDKTNYLALAGRIARILASMLRLWWW